MGLASWPEAQEEVAIQRAYWRPSISSSQEDAVSSRWARRSSSARSAIDSSSWRTAPPGRPGRDARSGRDGETGLIEQASTQRELPTWTRDEAGPYQAIPQPGTPWRPATSPARSPHEHVRHGTARLLTLSHPASGQVRVKGVTGAANAAVPPWLEAELTAILATLPAPPIQSDAERRAA